jgi:hypothetical protein
MNLWRLLKHVGFGAICSTGVEKSLVIPPMPQNHAPVYVVAGGQFISVGNNAVPLVAETVRPDHLLRSQFVPPSTLDLSFADTRFSLDVHLLEIPMDQMQWNTATASRTGDAMMVQTENGESIPIDSATLRYLVDPQYAAKIDKSISDLHMTPAEAQEAAELSKRTRDQRWNEVGDEDDL